MAISLGTRRIQFKGTIDMKKLLSAIESWFAKYSYDFGTTEYKEKVKEIEITISGVLKTSEYFKYNAEVYIHIYGIKYVNKEEQILKGWARITVSGSLETDYSGNWNKTAFLRWLKGIFEKYIYKKDILFKYANELDYKLIELQNNIKTALNMDIQGNAYG